MFIIPWFLVSWIDSIAWWLFGLQIMVTAQGGSGFHRGRIGADRVHFIRPQPGAVRPKPLKPGFHGGGWTLA